MIARRRIGGEADAWLMADSVMRQDLRFFDDLVERQHEVAGDAEDFPGAVILEALQESGRKRGHGAY